MKPTVTRGWPIADGDDFADGNASLWHPAVRADAALAALKPLAQRAYTRPAVLLRKAGGEPFGSGGTQYQGMSTVFDNMGFSSGFTSGLHWDHDGRRTLWRAGMSIGLIDTAATGAGWRSLQFGVQTQADPLDPESEGITEYLQRHEYDSDSGGEHLLLDTVIEFINGGTVYIWINHDSPSGEVTQLGDSWFWALQLDDREI